MIGRFKRKVHLNRPLVTNRRHFVEASKPKAQQWGVDDKDIEGWRRTSHFAGIKPEASAQFLLASVIQWTCGGVEEIDRFEGGQGNCIGTIAICGPGKTRHILTCLIISNRQSGKHITDKGPHLCVRNWPRRFVCGFSRCLGLGVWKIISWDSFVP